MFHCSTIVLSLTLLGGCSKATQAPIKPDPSSAPATAKGKTASLEAPNSEATNKTAEAGIAWQRDLPTAQTLATKKKRDLFIDISAEWCAPCQELEEITFADPKMAAILREGYVPLNLDVTEQTDEDLALMAKFGVKLLPALLVVRGEQILLTIPNFIGPKELIAKLAELTPR